MSYSLFSTSVLQFITRNSRYLPMVLCVATNTQANSEGYVGNSYLSVVLPVWAPQSCQILKIPDL
jgi:hypothetical protein